MAEVQAQQANVARGTLFGRYVILERLGAGATGEVYAAFDTQLSRKTALKLLRSDGSSGAQIRLIREAQAMAQLAHPNVIAVHDAGFLAGRVYLSMELIDGWTLSGWCREKGPGWREVLRVLLDAGEGVAAAHRAGLIHRDLKPDNVLVGRDGRVRVSDFGLARAAGNDGGTVPDEATLEETLSRPGAVPGTPAYMAPEQLRGARADRRSDQFSLCVTLYEALYGERPFAGETAFAVYSAARRNEVRPLPRGKRVPARVRKAVLRGLRADPAERWPSLEALLHELRRGPVLTVPRVAAAVLAAAAVAVILVPSGVCAGASAEWGGTWSGAQRTAARKSFEATAPGVARFVFSEVDRALSAYRSAWIESRTEACKQTRERHQQPDSIPSLRMQCLDERREEAASLARLFADADASVVERAASAVSELRPVSGCSNARALGAPVAPPADPARLGRLSDVRARGARVKALDAAGQYGRALSLVAHAIEEARTLGYDPLLAELLLRRGTLEIEVGRGDAAVRTLHEAAMVAERGRDDGTAADAWTSLSWLVGVQRGKREEGELWNRYAEAAIARLGGDDLREARRLLRLVALLRQDPARWNAVPALFRRQRDLLVRSGAPALLVAESDRERARFELETGRLEEARQLAEHAAAVRERVLGPAHPSLGAAWITVAVCRARDGRARGALEAYAKGARILASAGGALLEAALVESGVDRSSARRLALSTPARLEAGGGSSENPAWPADAERWLAAR